MNISYTFFKNIDFRRNIGIILFLVFFVQTMFAQTPAGFNLVAYEGFDYTSGTSLLNANGGSGWITNWQQAYQQRYLKTAATGFNYTGLATTGLKAEFDAICDGTCNQVAALKRTLPVQNSGVVFIQFISVLEASGGSGTPMMRLYNGTTGTGGIGANAGSYMAILDASLNNLSVTTANLSSQNLVVMRIDYNTNKTEMWVNPNLSTFNYANPSSPNATATGFAPAFDSFHIFMRSGSIDEIAVFSQITTAPTNITGTTTICTGDSTTLTVSGGAYNANTVDVWYKGACGGEAYHNGWDTAPSIGLTATTVNSVLSGILNVTSSTTDPMIELYSLGSFNPTVYKFINIRYRVVSGTAGLTQLFFTNTTYTEANGAAYVDSSLISDGNWHTLSIEMSTHANWATGGNITGLRYDYATNNCTMELDFIELSSTPIIGAGSSVMVAPTVNTTYFVSRKGPETNTSCISQLVTVNQIPVITNFNSYSKTYFDGSFTLANPTSDSAGSFSYISDNASVATISGNTVTITGIGTANITATQAANGSFCTNSTTVSLTVNDVSVVTKNGEISATNSNYVNHNGQIGGETGVTKNGELLETKSPFSGGSFDGFTYNLVTTATGRVWLDRNLGATQVATSTTDTASFGDLYQWGRSTDGHEKRTSANISTVSTTDTPGHGFFINANSFNWQSPVNSGLWQGVDSKNNPCPNGFRLPTIEEFEAEVVLWSSQNAAGALASPLKLPIAGRRHTDGNIYSVGSNGMYRTNSTFILNITSTSAARAGDERIDGFCVRCIKD